MKFGSSGLASALDTKSARTFAVVAASAIVVFFAVIGSVRATVPFQPSITMELSTNRATAHPDARITIDNSNSAENIKAMTMQLPNGFWGSLAAATKCDYVDAQNDNCTSASQIGTVDASAKIDNSDSRLRGKVYLTEPAPVNASTDPAGITVVVPAVVGNVNLGNVIVNARALIRNAALGVTAPTGAVGTVQGVNTVVDTIPESITDTNSRTVDFHLQKMSIDLVSDLDGPNPPLLTNPSVCSSIAVSASFTSWNSTSAAATDSTPEVISGCSGLSYNPTFTSTLSDPTAAAESGMTTEVSFPANSPSTKSISVKLPPVVGPNYPSFGQTGDQCNALAAPNGNSPFAPYYCPPQAKVGKVTLETPLLDGPVVGDVYLINKSPLPWLGIDINPSVSGSNPKGVTIRLVGQTNVPKIDLSCDATTNPWGECPTQISATFNNLPDAPATKMTLSLNGPSRTGIGPAPLSGKILVNATAGDPPCVPADDYTASLVSNAGASVKSDVVAEQTISGCSAPDVLIASGGSSPAGTSTTDTTPSVPFVGQNGHAAGPFQCFFDSEAGVGPCTSPFTALSALPVGVHRFYASYNSYPQSRAFVVKATPTTPDTTAPTTSITSPPTSVATSSPTLNFTSNDTVDFQCAINPGSSITTAFLPCATNGTSGSYSASNLFAGLTYTFGVRSEDVAGNVDLTPATATFTVDIAFAPTFQADISTYAARQHPDLDITVANPSHEDIKDITFNLPDGFFGGLTGVASLCPLANADAGTCPSSSQVGTVDAEADVDESTIRNSGTVYLTESRDPANEPASLSIKLHPAIQDVVFNDIIVNAHLKIRGVAQGIDAFALDLPHSATNALDGTTEFDLRKMVLKLRTGTGASYPLLTNPSDCRLMSYDASFTGYSASTASASQPFQATGCAGLPFAPALSITALDGDTGLPAGPSDAIKRKVLNLSANLTSTPDQAGIKNVVLTMPLPMTIDVQKLPTACSVAQQAAKACPAGAIIGTVAAKSPLLNETLNGSVYLLKADPATPSVTLPRLLIALRGRINVDIIATNSFVNGSQVVTKFSTLPDVPLTSFAINVNNLLTTTFKACDYGPADWNITGTLNGFNGSAANVVIPQKFDCPQAYGPVASYILKRKGAKSTLTANVTAQTGKKLKKKLTLSLPKGLTFNKAGFTKKKLAKLVTVKVNGKKLKASCFKKTSSSKFQVTFCGKSGSSITISFKAGTLTASKKLAKKPKFKMTAVDSDNKTKTVKTVTG